MSADSKVMELDLERRIAFLDEVIESVFTVRTGNEETDKAIELYEKGVREIRDFLDDLLTSVKGERMGLI